MKPRVYMRSNLDLVPEISANSNTSAQSATRQMRVNFWLYEIRPPHLVDKKWAAKLNGRILLLTVLDLASYLELMEIFSLDVVSTKKYWKALPAEAQRQNVLKYYLKKSRICPIWVSLTHFGPKSGYPGLESCKSNNKAVSMMHREIVSF